MNKALLSHADPDRKYERQFQALWPALKGSLAKIYKPCIRQNCPACARGDKHPAWILAVKDKGQRRCLYVPEELVPPLQRAIRNGRQLEQLLSRMGPILVKAYRHQRDTTKTTPDRPRKC